MNFSYYSVLYNASCENISLTTFLLTSPTQYTFLSSSIPKHTYHHRFLYLHQPPRISFTFVFETVARARVRHRTPILPFVHIDDQFSRGVSRGSVSRNPGRIRGFRTRVPETTGVRVEVVYRPRRVGGVCRETTFSLILSPSRAKILEGPCTLLLSRGFHISRSKSTMGFEAGQRMRAISVYSGHGGHI